MTAEERLTRIENAIHTLIETQEKHEAQLERQSTGIRDLIVVSRSLVDAQQATDNTIKQLIGTVDRLAATVDTFVQGFQKPNGNL